MRPAVLLPQQCTDKLYITPAVLLPQHIIKRNAEIVFFPILFPIQHAMLMWRGDPLLKLLFVFASCFHYKVFSRGHKNIFPPPPHILNCKKKKSCGLNTGTLIKVNLNRQNAIHQAIKFLCHFFWSKIDHSVLLHGITD